MSVDLMVVFAGLGEFGVVWRGDGCAWFEGVCG